jgi:DNA polymerase III sliding clamp (beta) subunit (PCNA family)
MLREDLLQALQMLGPGISKKETTAQSASFLLRGKLGCSCNGDLVMRTPMPAEFQFQGAVEAATLMAFLERIPDTEIKATFKSNKINIAGKGKKAAFLLDENIQAPIEDVEKPTEWHPLDPTFFEVAKHAAGAVSTDDDKFAVTCVYVDAEQVAATDGLQLVHGAVATPVASPTLLLGISLKPICGFGLTEIAETPKWVHFRNKTTRTVASLRKHKSDDFPSFRKLLKRRGVEFVVPSGIGTAIEVAKIMSDDDQIVVRLESGDDKKFITVCGEGQFGRFKETHPCEFKGESAEFAIKATLLKRLSDENAHCELGVGFIRCDSGVETYIVSTSSLNQEDSGD